MVNVVPTAAGDRKGLGAGRAVGLALAVAALVLSGGESSVVFPRESWLAASPESQGLSSAGLAEAVEYMADNFGAEGADELVIIRDGYLVHQGPRCDAYHALRSVTKVFTSTVLGVLVGDGRCGLETRAAELLPELAEQYPGYRGLRLRHLASMTGGYQGKVVDVGPGQEWGDPLVYVTTPDRPAFEPGSQIAYNDHDVHLLGRLLATRVAREPLGETFQRRIAGPLGMTRWEWGASGVVDGMVHHNAAGTPALRGGSGVKTTPLDLARLGLLYLNGGVWNGRQLLPSWYVAEATTTRVPPELPGRSRSLLGGAYGYYWWTNGLMATGRRRWPSAPAGAYTAHGGSTNYCLVIPEWRMVIVRMGETAMPGSYQRQDEIMNGFLARVAAALRAEPKRRPAVTGFTLIDADTDQPVAGHDPLADGTILDLDKLPASRLNIRANTEPATVGSVRFGHDHEPGYRTENSAPYAVGGDSGGDYEAWPIGPGEHALTATPYADRDGAGEAGTALSIRFQVRSSASNARRTRVAIAGEQWLLNGRPTYAGRTWRGRRVEGLLFNARLVQGVFDDLNPATRGHWVYPDTGTWDPDRNTAEFLAAMPIWRAHGLLAFSLNLQGGAPRRDSREQPWHNSGLTPAGAPRPEYLGRLASILDRADQLGMVVILGLFYFGQDERLLNEDAVCRAVDQVVEWVLDLGYENVVIEINNECDVRYDHAVLRPDRVHELIRRAQSHHRQGRRLLVSTSYGGGSIPGESVVRQADYLLLHGNGVDDPGQLAEMVRQTRHVPGYRPMPIVVNEDDHYDFDRPRSNLLAALDEYCSWGFFDGGLNNYRDGFQCPPVDWTLNTERKRAFFAKIKDITGP